MIRVLALVAFIGLIVSAICLNAATALGWRDVQTNHWRVPDSWRANFSDDDFSYDGPFATREIPWDGSHNLALDIAAQVEFTQAPGPGKLIITGPQDAISLITLRSGRLHIEGPLRYSRRFRIVMTAPEVTRFDINGQDRLTIAGYKQDSLELDVSGTARAVAAGEARAVHVEASGTGRVDLADVDNQSAVADVSGASRVTLAPKKSADLDVSGASRITLNSNPTELRSDISGAGRVIRSDGRRIEDDETDAEDDAADSD